MRVLAYLFSAVLILGPIVLWTLLLSYGCAYKISTGCNIHFSDYLDSEFLTLAAVPWAIGLTCLSFAIFKK